MSHVRHRPLMSPWPSLLLLPTVLRSSPLLAAVALCSVLTVVSASAEPDNNPLNIEWGPAPPPEKGPPLSRNASRDKSLLGAQVGAIVGSWLLFLAVLGCYIAFIGRRLRANALGTRVSVDVEMVKPALPRNFDPSPISPSKGASPSSPSKGNLPNFSWPSPTKQHFSTTTTSTMAGPFDERVLQEDKAQRERDMERLYAAVMEHEATDAATSPRAPKPERLSPKASDNGSSLSLPKLKSPKILRALTSPTLKSPTQPKPSPEKKKSKKDDESRRPSTSGQQRPPSLSSPTSDKRRGSIRGMKISKPIPTPTFSLHSRGQASDEEPLTPRYPPPTPPAANDLPPSPPHQHLPRGYSHAPSASVTSVSSSMRNVEPALQLSKPRSRTGAIPGKVHTTPGAPLSPPTSPPPPGPAATGAATSNSSSSSSLPLRSQGEHNGSYSNALPLRSLNTALGSNPSANTTKLTVVERPEHLRAQEGAGPRTGVPVPYSPFYMPYTPVTPITPGLVSRRERKAREKAEAAFGRGPRAKVVTEMTKGENELWDSGY